MTSCGNPRINDPYLDPGMRGYIVNKARRTYRKVAGYTLDDMIQEGYLVFYTCHRRYVGTPPDTRADGTLRQYLPPDNPDQKAKQHFMKLVKRSFSNRVFTLMSHSSADVEITASMLQRADQSEEQFWDTVIVPESEVATAAALLASAPAEIKQLFALMISDAVDGYRRFGAGRRARRETNNQYFSRLLGINTPMDISGMVEAHFLG